MYIMLYARISDVIFILVIKNPLFLSSTDIITINRYW